MSPSATSEYLRFEKHPDFFLLATISVAVAFKLLLLLLFSSSLAKGMGATSMVLSL